MRKEAREEFFFLSIFNINIIINKNNIIYNFINVINIIMIYSTLS